MEEGEEAENDIGSRDEDVQIPWSIDAREDNEDGRTGRQKVERTPPRKGTEVFILRLLMQIALNKWSFVVCNGIPRFRRRQLPNRFSVSPSS